MTSILSFIIVLGVLIFIHEFGHFLFAKLFRVGVEKFSLGFGPRLVGKRIGETEYRISAFPLGGYVKMVGENGEEELSPEDAARS
ncbi:MAG: site-2 protease family protein, partial [Geobacteraceae bacterium]|nr:site-2 protease family protein [Geobacteraceae bacterium]